MTKTKKTTKLARDCFCDSIHGVTGRVYEEGTLPAGTPVRNVVTQEWTGTDGSARESTEFEASTDGGKTWYRQRTGEPVKGLVA